MSRLSHHDLQDALEFVGQLHACHEPTALRRLTVRGVLRMIRADRVTFEHFAPTVPQLWAVAEPDTPYLPWMWETFLAHLNEHPGILHYQVTGDCSAVKISDFAATRKFHKTQLYQNLYRKIGYEDQMGICLAPRQREFFAVVVSRGNRSFSERDRALLSLLRPHIGQAHANARALDRLHRCRQGDSEVANWLKQTAILLNRNAQVRHCPEPARRCLRKYFGQEFQRNQLPAELDMWLRQQMVQHSKLLETDLKPAQPLVREINGSRAIFRLESANGSHLAIIVEEQSAPGTRSISALGLTRQQVRILLEVEKGKTNTEIASALFLSPHTVRTHLDNIFDILNVTNRTAAVARLRGIA